MRGKKGDEKKYRRDIRDRKKGKSPEKRGARGKKSETECNDH